jgi:hypothetical protein
MGTTVCPACAEKRSFTEPHGWIRHQKHWYTARAEAQFLRLSRSFGLPKVREHQPQQAVRTVTHGRSGVLRR